MVNAVCPKCKDQSMIQDSKKLGNFSCSRCGEEFMLLPAKPRKKDIAAVWDYLIQAKQSLKELEQLLKTQG